MEKKRGGRDGEELDGCWRLALLLRSGGGVVEGGGPWRFKIWSMRRRRKGDLWIHEGHRTQP